MSYESTAEPIKIGYRMGLHAPSKGFRRTVRFVHQNSTCSSKRRFAQGVMRTVPCKESTARWRGCPRVRVKSVIDAYGEIVDEGTALWWLVRTSPTPGVPVRSAHRGRTSRCLP